jgi:hypothetical protein
LPAKYAFQNHELKMSNPFFDHPILNSPYECPRRHWELDSQGQPTQRILETRRRAEFITPIPKPKKRKKATKQEEMVFDEGKGLSTKEQQYDPTSIINEVRQNVDAWRALPNQSHWQVTPETARLLDHWRHYQFSGVRPFFCQVEAVETAIWLTEVAPQSKNGKRLIEHMASANSRGRQRLIQVKCAGDRAIAKLIVQKHSPRTGRYILGITDGFRRRGKRGSEVGGEPQRAGIGLDGLAAKFHLGVIGHGRDRVGLRVGF